MKTVQRDRNPDPGREITHPVFPNSFPFASWLGKRANDPAIFSRGEMPGKRWGNDGERVGENIKNTYN